MCKRALGVREEPYMSYMTVLYGAEIYKELLPEEYRFISKDETLKLLRSSRVTAWCTPSSPASTAAGGRSSYATATAGMRAAARLPADKGGLYPVPLIARADAERCKGVETCGKCLEVCPFRAFEERDSRSFVSENYMGCAWSAARKGQDPRLQGALQA